MNLDNKVALSAYYKGRGLNNADIAVLLRVDASSVSRYLKQAEENKWLQQKVQLRLPRELDRMVQSTVRAVELEDALFRLFSASPENPTPNAVLHREGFVVVRTSAAADDSGRQSGQVNARAAKKFDELGMAMMSIEGGRLLLDLLSQRQREQPTVLGVTWGRSTGRVVSCLGEMSLPDLPNLVVVALQGGVGRGLSQSVGSQYYPDILAERLSLLFRSRVTPVRITLPAYISAKTAADVKQDGLKAIWKFIESDVSFQQATLSHETLDIALIGIGGFENGAWALSSGYVPNSDMVTSLLRAGAVGDIACRFIRDRVEQPIEGWDACTGDTEAIRQTNLRAIGISLASLRERVGAGARVLAVAGGRSGAKAGAIRAALRGGFVTEIVTDEATAVSILRGGGTFRSGAVVEGRLRGRRGGRAKGPGPRAPGGA